MPIGVDIDDVLFPFLQPFCRFLNQKYHKNLKEEDFKGYDFWKYYSVPLERGGRDVEEFCETQKFKEIMPCEGAIAGISKLQELDRLVVVSSRNSIYFEHTRSQISKYFPNAFDNIFLCSNFVKLGKKIKKRAVCERETIWLMIEDIKSNVEDIARDIPVIMPSKPWNRDVYGSNIISASTWKEIVSKARGLNSNPYSLF